MITFFLPSLFKYVEQEFDDYFLSNLMTTLFKYVEQEFDDYFI